VTPAARAEIESALAAQAQQLAVRVQADEAVE
jgi:hypothetical protein